MINTVDRMITAAMAIRRGIPKPSSSPNSTSKDEDSAAAFVSTERPIVVNVSFEVGHISDVQLMHVPLASQVGQVPLEKNSVQSGMS